MKIKVYDIETYPNLFTFVARSVGEKKFDIFIKYDDPKKKDSINQLPEFVEYLKNKKYIFVGFNNIQFDAPVIEMILDKKGQVSNQEIYNYAQKLINDDTFRGKSFWGFKTKQIDLYTMWSFNTSQRRTSLKWLEFSMRAKKIRDLPLEHFRLVSKSNLTKVITYNKYDVERTEALYELSKDKLKLRKMMAKKYNDFRFLSKGDVDLGADSFLYDLAESMDISVRELRKQKTKYDSLKLGDIIIKDKLLYYSDEFKEVQNTFEEKVLVSNDEGLLNIKGAITHSINFGGVEFNYGTGGLHASTKTKMFVTDDNYLIIDLDVKSFYPNLAIVNKLHPKHLGMKFVVLYKKLYDERALIEKSNPLNLSKKLSLNAIFGKSNSKYSYLYDTGFTLGITINGQLQLSMLADILNKVSSIIQVNTDGITVMVHKKNLKKLEKVVEWWQKKTGLILEEARYKQMAITDVNNYHSIYTNDKVKRKGKYAIYEDYIVSGKEEFHKNPSALIIPKAINEYYTNKDSIRETVMNENNIFNFLIGYKKRNNFEFMIAQPTKSGYIDISKNKDRVIRYYVSNEGASIYKITKELSITTLAKNIKLKMAQNLRTIDAANYIDLDREYYVDEANKWIDEMELINNKEFCYGK